MWRSVRQTLRRSSLSSQLRYESQVAGASAQNALSEIITDTLREVRLAGTLKRESVITTPQASSIGVDDRRFLNLCSNNYLGLANHPSIVTAAHRHLDTHGFGLSSVRFICGTQDIHKELEQKIAEFHGTEDAILYPSCYDANAALFEAVLTADDAVISDQLNHASIIDGIRLCKAERHRYKHLDLADLKHKLELTRGKRLRLIATDGVFSMDGHIAPLADIVDLAREYGALVFVDDCHATGVIGKSGRGTEEHCGVLGTVDILNSTLGKALGGGTGGYTAGSAELIALLRQTARPYLFSNALAPAMAGGALAAIERLSQCPELVTTLHNNTAFFREAMQKAGFDVGGGCHPIVPIRLGDAALAGEFAAKLLLEGIFVVAFSYPVVPRGQARVRVQVSAEHSREQLTAAVAAFQTVGKNLGVLQ